MARMLIGNVKGPAGIGVPAGGSTGQMLKKASATDFDTSWGTLYASAIPMTSSDSTKVDAAITSANQAIANVDNKARTYDIGVISSGTIESTLKAFAQSHGVQYDITVRFYCSGEYRPSDLPTQDNSSYYGYGEAVLRNVDISLVLDGIVYFYGWGNTNVYVKKISNNTFGTWEQLALNSKIVKSATKSGTTSATTGVLDLGIGSNTHVVSAYADQYMALPYFSSGSWRVVVIDSSSANGIVQVKNTNVTVTYYYYE